MLQLWSGQKHARRRSGRSTRVTNMFIAYVGNNVRMRHVRSLNGDPCACNLVNACN